MKRKGVKEILVRIGKEKAENIFTYKRKTEFWERRRRKPKRGKGKRENPFSVNCSSKFR